MGEKIERYSSLKFKKWLHLKQCFVFMKREISVMVLEVRMVITYREKGEP